MRTHLTHLETKPLTAEREWDAEGVRVLRAAVSLPEPVQTQGLAVRRIRRYYRLQCRSFFKYCALWLVPEAAAECRAALEASRPFSCRRAALSYAVTFNGGGLWSLYTQSRERTADGASFLTRRGDVWDLRTGAPLPLSLFFPRRPLWRRQVLRYVTEEAERRVRCGAARYHEGWRRALRRYFNARNYYLTEEGIALFYPMGALAPFAEGIPVFTIPWSECGVQPPERSGGEAHSPEP